MKQTKNLLNILILFIIFFATWFCLSGFEKPFFLILGAISCLLAMFIGHRMTVIDHERHPVYLKFRAPLYFVWLIKEMLLSSIAVALKVWLPDSKISPTLSWINSTQKTPEARSIYGNSITLTPGTVCTDTKDKKIQVHALTKAGINSLKKGIMDRKVTESIG